MRTLVEQRKSGLGKELSKKSGRCLKSQIVCWCLDEVFVLLSYVCRIRKRQGQGKKKGAAVEMNRERDLAKSRSSDLARANQNPVAFSTRNEFRLCRGTRNED